MKASKIQALELAYGDHPLNKIDVYWPEDDASSKEPHDHEQSLALFVFVHGGAWRSGDKNEYVSFAHDLVHKSGCAVANINYRISPRKPEDGPAVRHPAHTLDGLHALQFLLDLSHESVPSFRSSHMILAGHSAGGHMLATIFLHNPVEELTPSRELLASVKGIMLIEGIADVDLLLQRHPTYVDFIQGAFGSPGGENGNYQDVSPCTYGGRKGGAHIMWLIVQSQGDSLIKQNQADAMWDGLQGATRMVEMDSTSVTGEHFQLLTSEEFYNVVDKFAKKCKKLAECI